MHGWHRHKGLAIDGCFHIWHEDVEGLQPSHVSLSPLLNPFRVLIRRKSHASVL